MGRNKIQRNNYLNKVCECLTCNTLITDTEELTLCKCKSTFIRMICWTRKKYCLSCSNNKLVKLTIDSDNKQSLLSCDDLGALAVASTVSAVKEDEYDNKQSLLSCEDRGFTLVKSEPYTQASPTLLKDSSAYNALRTRLLKGKLFLNVLSLFLVSFM